MGFSLSRSSPGRRSFPSSVSWFDLKARFFVPTCASLTSMRAESVQGWLSPQPCGMLRLDSFEHDGTQCGRDDDQRGARFRARFSRAATLYSVEPRTRTMMQSCASAAKLRSGGPILPFGVQAKVRLGIPPTRTVIVVPAPVAGPGRKPYD